MSYYTEHFDEDLSPVLTKASNEDLDPLVQYILKAELTETLSINDLYKRFTPDHKQYVECIEQEIRYFGGNSFVNIFRENGPAYAEIVRDVAKKLKANFNKHSSIEEIESAILVRIMSQSWGKMTPEEKQAFVTEMGIGSGIGSLPKALPVAALQLAIKASGFLVYRLAVIVAHAIAKAVLGQTLRFTFYTSLTRGIATFAGPIGWAVTGLWTAVDVAGPAYRVTIPCIVHIAMLRQQQAVLCCKECGTPYTAGTRFCSQCGIRLD